MLVLMWVQTVCNLNCQQMIKVAATKVATCMPKCTTVWLKKIKVNMIQVKIYVIYKIGSYCNDLITGTSPAFTIYQK